MQHAVEAATLEAFITESLERDDRRRELALPTGGRYVFERDPEPGVAHDVTSLRPDGSVASRQRTFTPGDAPAPSYPHDAPFVAGVPVSTTTFGANGAAPVLVWDPVEDPAALAAELVAASRRSGWGDPPGARPALGRAMFGVLAGVARLATRQTLRIHILRHGDRQRMIQATRGRRGSGMVTLADLPVSPAGQRGGAGADRAPA